MYKDTFTNDKLPPKEQMAELLFELEELKFPEKLNVAEELLDKKVKQGRGNNIAVFGPDTSYTYNDMLAMANQIAHVLVDDFSIVPGNRVLLRAPNTPLLAACWLGVIKAGGVCVTTMPLLRAADLVPIVNAAEIDLALCDSRLSSELFEAQNATPFLSSICLFNEPDGESSSSLEHMMGTKSVEFANYQSAADDVAIIAFTSGTTGLPKGAMHFHRDILSMCVCAGQYIIRATQDDVFAGTPPLAFTFGLGVLLAFPFYSGGATILAESRTPLELINDIHRFKATICATAPAGYLSILNNLKGDELKSLRKSIAGGDVLPPFVFHTWKERTGISMINSFGSTEMIHMFISAVEEQIDPEYSGKAIPGYRACILNEAYEPVPPGVPGLLAVKGPTACKYLGDERQRNYVVNGWNLTGDICEINDEAYIRYISRVDDMIISSGHNISGIEVEAMLIEHDAVKECAVIGVPHAERGMIVKAFIVLEEGVAGTEELTKEIQAFSKSRIAPYKYPRTIEYLDELPKTQTGKLQRNKLKLPA